MSSSDISSLRCFNSRRSPAGASAKIFLFSYLFICVYLICNMCVFAELVEIEALVGSASLVGYNFQNDLRLGT